ncbi:MAG: hypothetical protein R3275_04980 [Saprospiraceae bacterium]|nr:hypothetical protein [Saprospiraceae bacterium]
MRYLLWICLVLPLGTQAQNLTATVSSNSILIGDHVRLNLEVQSGSAVPRNLILDKLDKAEAFEIVKPGEWQKNENSGFYEQSMIITSFDSGTHYLPEIGAILEYNDLMDTVYSNPIPINVNTVAPDSLGLAPVKPIIEEKKVWSDYLIYAIPVLALILFLLALWLWSRRKKKIEESHEPIPLPLPHVEALDSLEELEKEKLWQHGEAKLYETRLSLILRRYIERQFEFPAMEWTTREITTQLAEHRYSELIPITLVSDILSQSDLVKYAKSDPGAEAYAAQVNKARTFIRETKNMVREEE